MVFMYHRKCVISIKTAQHIFKLPVKEQLMVKRPWLILTPTVGSPVPPAIFFLCSHWKSHSALWPQCDTDSCRFFPAELNLNRSLELSQTLIKVYSLLPKTPKERGHSSESNSLSPHRDSTPWLRLCKPI